jgi:hypothetical protein
MINGYYTKNELMEKGYKELSLQYLSSADKTFSIELSMQEVNEIIRTSPKKNKDGIMVHEIPKEYSTREKNPIIVVALRKKDHDYFLTGSLFHRNGTFRNNNSVSYQFITEDLVSEQIELSEIEELLTKN